MAVLGLLSVATAARVGELENHSVIL